MSLLSEYLVSSILLEDDFSVKKTIAIYSGRFQPIHKGHASVYRELVTTYGKNNVYIATSNKIESLKSPFSFDQKVKMMTKLFDIPASNIVKVKNPYSAQEILKNYDKNTTACIFVVGDKDTGRLSPESYTRISKKETPTLPFSKQKYAYIVGEKAHAINATSIRNNLSLGTPEQKKKFFKSVYPKFDQEIFDLMVSTLSERIEIKKETIENWLITEASSILPGGKDVDDGPIFLFPNYEVFKLVSAKRAAQLGMQVVNMLMTKDLEDIYDHPKYPTGPVDSTSYFPAGIVGTKTSTNQADLFTGAAYTQWYKHVTRLASLIGYSVVISQLKDDKLDSIKKLANLGAKGNKSLREEFNIKLNEMIQIPVNIGDTILTGKFKNKKTVVKSFGKDEHGMPTINGKKVVTFRMVKNDQNIFKNEVELSKTNIFEKAITGFKNLGVPRKDMPQIESKLVPDFLKYLKRNNVSYKTGLKKISNLKLTQREINPEKIEQLITTDQNELSKPIIVAKDGYILDGHHRVLAKYRLDNNDHIPTIEVNLGIRDLLKIANGYGKTKYKDIHESDSISGGLTDNVSLQDIAKKHKVKLDVLKKQWVKGVKVEMEHTDDIQISKEIAKDHLFEFPDYYDRLEKLEKPVDESAMFHPVVAEMSKSQLDRVEKYADKELSPDDVKFTNHFFDRINDPRNGKEISEAELIGFFKRLGKYKSKLIEFLTKYQEIVITDKRTQLNVPLVKSTNAIIAKTIMRKQDFKSSSPKLNFEDYNPNNISSKSNQHRKLRKEINKLTLDVDKWIDSYLTESTGKPKVVIMAGGAAVGKSTVLKQLGVDGLPQFNPDKYVEDPKHPYYNNLSAASSQVNKDVDAAVKKGQSFIWDTTASNPKKVDDLKKAGYDVFMVMVYTHPMISFIANFQRERNVPKATVFKTWDSVYSLAGHYKSKLGNDFAISIRDREGQYSKEVRDFDNAASKGENAVTEYLKSYINDNGGSAKFASTFSKPIDLTNDEKKSFESFVKPMKFDRNNFSEVKFLQKSWKTLDDSGKLDIKTMQKLFDKWKVSNEKNKQNELDTLKNISNILFDKTFQSIIKDVSIGDIKSNIANFLRK